MRILLKEIKFEDSSLFSCLAQKKVQIFVTHKNRDKRNACLMNENDKDAACILHSIDINTGRAVINLFIDTEHSDKLAVRASKEFSLKPSTEKNHMTERSTTRNGFNHLTEVDTRGTGQNHVVEGSMRSNNEYNESHSQILRTQENIHGTDEIGSDRPQTQYKIQNAEINNLPYDTDPENSTIMLEIFKKGKEIAAIELLRDRNKVFSKHKKLRFTVLYEYLEKDSFSFMDNSTVEGPLTESAVSFSSYEVRKYQNSLYTVESSCLSTDWTKNPDEMPLSINHGGGWEEIRMENGVFFWVNHPFQVILPPGKTQYTYEEELGKKMTDFLSILDRIEIFKYLIFTKFTLFTQRYNFIQSSASYFLRVSPDFIRRSLRIKIKDEIGEDEGGIRNEFFSEVAYEIASDPRMAYIGDFLDVNPTIYDEQKIPEKKAIWRNNTHSPVDVPEDENMEQNHISDSSQDELDYKNYSLGEMFIQREISRKPGNEFDPLRLWGKSDFELDQGEMSMLKRKFTSGLSFSKITNIKTNVSLKFWQTTEKKNKKFIEDTDPDFFTSKNVGKNLLSDDEFYAYVGVFLALSILNQETMAVKFSLPFIENLFGANMDLTHIQDLEVQKNLLHILRTDLDDEYLDIIDDQLLRTDKYAYVSSHIHENMFFSKKRAYDIIYYFFYSIIPHKFSKIFTAQDIYFLLNGIEALTFDFFMKSLYITNTQSKSIEITYLFNILKRKDETYYRKFLKFVTGSEVIALKKDNESDNRIFIEQDTEKNALFRASSCVKILFIGTYDTEEDMERIMDFSILNTEGFHKV